MAPEQSTRLSHKDVLLQGPPVFTPELRTRMCGHVHVCVAVTAPGEVILAMGSPAWYDATLATRLLASSRGNGKYVTTGL